MTQLFARACHGRVIPIQDATARLGIPPQLCAIAERATHPDRGLRHASVAELRRDLHAFLHQ